MNLAIAAHVHQHHNKTNNSTQLTWHWQQQQSIGFKKQQQQLSSCKHYKQTLSNSIVWVMFLIQSTQHGSSITAAGYVQHGNQQAVNSNLHQYEIIQKISIKQATWHSSIHHQFASKNQS